jgi:hypothetical protein
MLVDRSLRSMAALMTVFAVAMIIIVIAYAKDFANRANLNSTSVGSKEGEDCHSMEARNIVSLMFAPKSFMHYLNSY